MASVQYYLDQGGALYAQSQGYPATPQELAAITPGSGNWTSAGSAGTTTSTGVPKEAKTWGMALVAALVLAIGVEEAPKIGVPFLALVVLVMLYLWKGNG